MLDRYNVIRSSTDAIQNKKSYMYSDIIQELLYPTYRKSSGGSSKQSDRRGSEQLNMFLPPTHPTTHRPSPTTHRPPPTAHRPPPIAHRPLPIAHRPSPIAHRPPPITHRPPPTAHRPSPTALRPPPTVPARCSPAPRSSPWSVFIDSEVGGEEP